MMLIFQFNCVSLIWIKHWRKSQ